MRLKPIRRLVALVLLLSALPCNIAQAGTYLDNHRFDRDIPQNCQDLTIKSFDKGFRKIFFGIKGSKSLGFTHESPVNREEASFLWETFHKHREFDNKTLARLQQQPWLQEPYGILYQNGLPKGFDFGSEGDVLELLALVALQKEYPADKYFITGGMIYHEASSRTELGELDIVVVRTADCKVVAVGESKLGTKSLGFAREQLGRFINFLAKKLRVNPRDLVRTCESPLAE